MKSWILVLIAGLLLLWSLSRERFVETMVGDTPQPTCSESGYVLRGNKTLCDFTPVDSTCVPGTEWKPGHCTRVCPSGTTMMGGSTTTCIKDPIKPVCPSGFTFEIERASGSIEQTGKCKPNSSTQTGTTAGGTTGGSSTTSAAPNAGPVGSTGKGNAIYGPVFTELGQGDGRRSGADTSKTNQYPELIGGVGDVTSVRTPSGIRNPSQSWFLSQSGALPSTASLGSDANAGYFPYSRAPGDQDLIPDPYRLNRNYSTASYSSKTDPVPFLTDFSAFFK